MRLTSVGVRGSGTNDHSGVPRPVGPPNTMWPSTCAGCRPGGSGPSGGAGGICLAADEGRAEKVDKMRLCLHETDLSDDTGDDSLGGGSWGDTGTATTQQLAAQCQTGADADRDETCRFVAVENSLGIAGFVIGAIWKT